MKKIISLLLIVLSFAASAQTINVRLIPAADGWVSSTWNSWIVPGGVQGALSSSALLDSTKTATTVKATLSSSAGVAVNSAAYLAKLTMAPAQALANTSYSTTTRTLSLSGLNDSATYVITLFATRERTDGQVTTFAIGGSSQTIITDGNNTPVVFKNVKSSGGSLQVQIGVGAGKQYSFFSGFSISGSAPAPVIVSIPKIDSASIYKAYLGSHPLPAPAVVGIHNDFANGVWVTVILFKDGSTVTVPQ